MVVETKKAKSKKLGRNRGIPKTQLGLSLDQKLITAKQLFTYEIYRDHCHR